MCGTPHRSRRTSTTLSRPETVMVPSSCARRPRAESSSSAREGSWADSSAGSTKLQSAGLIMERERLREVSQPARSEEHTSELQSQSNLVCRLLLEKKKKKQQRDNQRHNNIYAQNPPNTPRVPLH